MHGIGSSKKEEKIMATKEKNTISPLGTVRVFLREGT
jgi:hypothetical protein